MFANDNVAAVRGPVDKDIRKDCWGKIEVAYEYATKRSLNSAFYRIRKLALLAAWESFSDQMLILNIINR